MGTEFLPWTVRSTSNICTIDLESFHQLLWHTMQQDLGSYIGRSRGYVYWVKMSINIDHGTRPACIGDLIWCTADARQRYTDIVTDAER